jgi:hypothetical protein
MNEWGMRSGPWRRARAPLALTIITCGGGGHGFGAINATREQVTRLVHQARMTAKHIAQGGCRGPRPKE